MKVELIQTMGSDLTVVNSARVSLNKEKQSIDDKDIKLIKYLIKNKHVSVLEHCFFTFRFEIPIYIARQLMRHRSWSFNEVSGRYVEFEEKFFTPESFRFQSPSIKQGSVEDVDGKLSQSEVRTIYNKAITHQYNAYKQLLDMGVAREQARGLLGTALYTNLYGSCNLRSLIHFLELRLHEHSQKEIRDLAQEMYCLVKQSDQFKHVLDNFNYEDFL